MGFNYAKERRRFEREWAKLRELYRTAGFPEESIEAMYAFDKDVFRGRRRFENHSQEFPAEDFGENCPENRTVLFTKYESLTVTFDESSFEGRYAWVDEISDASLVWKLKRLNCSDIELLTLIAIEGYNQTEAACLMGCSQKNISLKMTRIKKYFRNP